MPRSDGTWTPTRCIGKVRNGANKGNQCPLWAMRGAEYCHKHGGRLPNIQKKAKRTRAQMAAEKAVIMYGLPREIAPIEALMDELARTQGHVDWLHNIIMNIDALDDLIKGTVSEVHRSGVADETNWDEERIEVVENIWIRMYARERKHLVEVAKTIQALGLAEQMVRITQQQAAMFDSAIQGLVARLGHDINDTAVRTAVAESLTTVINASIPVSLPA